jgi:hypothetical protein
MGVPFSKHLSNVHESKSVERVLVIDQVSVTDLDVDDRSHAYSWILGHDLMDMAFLPSDVA